jgi:prepilin-type N-terminal cleavage/methylation domain-containing protein
MNVATDVPAPILRDRRLGFSLIEVLAVVALISVVMFVALNFYTDLARATARASNHTHDIRRAVAILDRVARDFESAMLVVKPAEMDPISHPWLFIGESELGAEGADHVKFVTRNHDPTRSDNPESDIAVVAYTVEHDESGLLSLYRWSSPRLPEELDRSYPRADDEGSYLMAEGLHTFAIQFIGPDGETTSEWDSTTLIQSGTLPAAVEIQVAMASKDVSNNLSEDPDEETDPLVYRRRALIRVPAVDMALLLTGDDCPVPPCDGEDNENNPENGTPPTGGGKPTNSGTDLNIPGNTRTGANFRGDAGNFESDDTTTAKTIGECVDLSGIRSNDRTATMVRALLSSLANKPWDPSIVRTLPAGATVNPSCR